MPDRVSLGTLGLPTLQPAYPPNMNEPSTASVKFSVTNMVGVGWMRATVFVSVYFLETRHAV
jgi:hypothetical protein